eukprot:PhF_6_TR40009/c0_g1_i1/m.59378
MLVLMFSSGDRLELLPAELVNIPFLASHASNGTTSVEVPPHVSTSSYLRVTSLLKCSNLDGPNIPWCSVNAAVEDLVLADFFLLNNLRMALCQEFRRRFLNRKTENEIRTLFLGAQSDPITSEERDLVQKECPWLS